MATNQSLLGKPQPKNNSWKHDNFLHLARVIAIHPESYTVDAVLMGGGIHRNVQVLSISASSNTGINMLVNSDPSSDKAGGNIDTDKSYDKADRAEEAILRDVYCVIGYLEGERRIPVCLGFTFPEVTQMLFNKLIDSSTPPAEAAELEKLRNPFVFRHHDVRIIIKDNGATELRTKDGTTIRIGEEAEPTDLTGRDFDGTWKDDPRDLSQLFATETPPVVADHYVDIKHVSGTRITINPDGKIVVAGVKGIDTQAQLDYIIKSVTENIRIEVVEDLKKMNLVAEAIFAGTDEVSNDFLATWDFLLNKYNEHKHSGGGSKPIAAFQAVLGLPDTTERFQAD